MAERTPVTRDIDPVEALNELIQLEFDAIAAYDAAIDRLNGALARQKLREFRQDHERHTTNLADLVRQRGGIPKMHPDAKRILTKGRVVLANLAGDGRILRAMRTNEDDTMKKYRRVLRIGALDQAARTTLESNLEDERRHRAWLVAQLGES